jgi:hypothetical protein
MSNADLKSVGVPTLSQAIALKEAIARLTQQQQQQQQPIAKPIDRAVPSAPPADQRPVPPPAAASASQRNGSSVGGRRVSVPEDMTDQYFSMELLRDPVIAADGFT